MANTTHSKHFAKVKKYYNAGVWNEARVYNAVGSLRRNTRRSPASPMW